VTADAKMEKNVPVDVNVEKTVSVLQIVIADVINNLMIGNHQILGGFYFIKRRPLGPYFI
jgi:hypothetical protein